MRGFFIGDEMKMAFYILGVLLGGYIGYVFAHNVIARECKILGGFYVGKETFKCVKVEVSPNPEAHEGEEHF